jgi:hypothetical protein
VSDFDFIFDENVRASLESDLCELRLCFDAKAWKAVHVLSGSIVEALLIDLIIVESYATRDEALKKDLGSALSLCKAKAAISARVYELASVIRGYRNLIHPGRVIRLDDSVSQESAEVAKALVGMVIDEIEKRRKDKFGYTAEQIVAKIQRDSSVNSILPDLIKTASSHEISRLLLTTLPDAYFEFLGDDFPPHHIPNSYTLRFRIALDQAHDDLKRKVAERFVKLMKEESDFRIQAYAQLFFRASELAQLPPENIGLVKKYLFSRFAKEPDVWLDTLEGVGPYLVPEDVLNFVDPLVRLFVGGDKDVSDRARKRLEAEHWSTPGAFDKVALKRLDEWASFYRSRGSDALADKVEDLKASYDLPF